MTYFHFVYFRFNADWNHERVNFGDVSSEFSVVAYPSQVLVYENRDHKFERLRHMRLAEKQWIYLLNVFRGMLLTVYR